MEHPPGNDRFYPPGPGTDGPQYPRSLARRGRPAGKHQGGPRREKVTLRVDAELIADYREWSWKRRCQLCELVEDALRAYRRSQPESPGL